MDFKLTIIIIMTIVAIAITLLLKSNLSFLVQVLNLHFHAFDEYTSVSILVECRILPLCYSMVGFAAYRSTKNSLARF